MIKMHYLTYIRIKNGFSQERLAEEAKMCRRTLNYYEGGHKYIRRGNAEKLAAILKGSDINLLLRKAYFIEIDYADYLELKKMLPFMRNPKKSLKEVFLSLKLRKHQTGIVPAFHNHAEI